MVTTEAARREHPRPRSPSNNAADRIAMLPPEIAMT